MHKPLTVGSKQASTVCAEEVLGVPGLVQSCQDVLVNRPDRETSHHAFASFRGLSIIEEAQMESLQKLLIKDFDLQHETEPQNPGFVF